MKRKFCMLNLPHKANWFSLVLLITSVTNLAIIVEGDQRTIHVSELISDNVLSNDEDGNDFTYCV